MRVHRVLLGIAAAIAGSVASGSPTETGQVVDDVKLALVEGGTASLADRSAAANVVLFFRPGQERSLEALRAIGECQVAFTGKAARFVGVVSGETPAADVRAALADAGAKLPVFLDAGDALYAKLGVRTHPAIAVLDRARRLVAFETHRQVGLCDVVRARVRRLLGEISEAELARALAPAESQLPGEDPLGVAARHVKLGRKLLGARAFGQAHDNARKSLDIAPSAAAWALEGEIFAAEGRCPDALRAFEAALDLDPKDAAAAAGKRGCAR